MRGWRDRLAEHHRGTGLAQARADKMNDLGNQDHSAETLRQDLLAGLCQIDFACHQGEPNWLGIVAVLVGLLTVAALASAAVQRWRR